MAWELRSQGCQQRLTKSESSLLEHLWAADVIQEDAVPRGQSARTQCRERGGEERSSDVSETLQVITRLDPNGQLPYHQPQRPAIYDILTMIKLSL